MLYIVATPIGNLGDISQRALEILSECDLIAAEDTRRTQKLLSYYQIRKPLLSYHEHNKISRGPVFIEKLLQGENIALVSDAGTPGISDPGADLIRLATEQGIPVTMAPGPVAGIMALVLSGLPAERFVFEGFIGTDNKKRAAFSKQIAAETRTTILYEAPHRLLKTLQLLAEAVGGRRIAVCRELTKTHEEIRRGTASDHLSYFTENEPRGEFVLVIEGAILSDMAAGNGSSTATSEDVYRITEEILEESSGIGKKEALKEAAARLNLSKNQAYALYEEAKQAHN